MKKIILLILGYMCVIVPSVGGVVSEAFAQQDRIRVVGVEATHNPFDPRSGQTTTITGSVLEFSDTPDLPLPLVSAQINERIEVPVTLTPGESVKLDEVAGLYMKEWQFSLTWDGTVPWDLFPKGRYTCVIIAESGRKPGLRATQTLRLFIQSANPPLTQ